MSVHRGYAAVSFGQIHYRYAGTPGKPVIVLLHQTPSTSEMYEDLMNALSGEFRLVAPDTPGMGMSDPVDGEMTIEKLADGVAELLDELGVDDCMLFGHHTGASIAADLAARLPRLVKSLVLAGPPLLNDEMREMLPAAGAPFPTEANGSHMSGMWNRIARKDPDVSLQVVLRDALSGLRIGERYLDAYMAVMNHDFESAMTTVRCPVLVFAGTNDVLFDAVQGTAKLVSNARTETIDDAWSFVCETHSDVVASLVRDFHDKEAAA